MIKILNAILAILAGVGGMLAVYWLLNAAVERLPNRWEERLKPFVFVGPAVLVVGIFLVYPAVQTIHFSFADRNSQEYVGFENYTELFKSEGFLKTLLNNFLWILIVPAVSVIVGLLIAVLADRLRPTAEKVAKSVIFMPMAISFVGASTIWAFVYATRFAKDEGQIGILSAITTTLGFDPVAWLRIDDWNFNDILLMVIMIWLQAGFAMVLLSAAVKGVPEDTLEAARIDGATELQIFRVVVPQIWPTVIVVFTTVLILVMKVFDIVYVMTGGAFGTQVVANTFIDELIEFGDAGRAAAVVVVLMIAVIPVMIYQVHRFRVQEAER